MLALGLAAYGAVFACVGARLKRPLVVGLVFAFGWEPAVLLFPGYLKRLTVAYYLQALVPARDARGLGRQRAAAGLHEVPGDPVSLVALAVIYGGRPVAGRAGGRSARVCAGTVSRR